MGNKRILIYAMLWYMIRPGLDNVNGGRTVFDNHMFDGVMPPINLE